jgi:hypothetical protein
MRLLKGPADTPSNDLVQCELVHVEQKNLKRTKYRALSYTWGEEHPLRTIVVSDKPFSLGQLFPVLEGRSGASEC